MKLLLSLFVVTLIAFGASGTLRAEDQSPEQACAYIKAVDCYGALKCNKQKRDFAACVKEKNQQRRAKHQNQKMPPKGKR